MVLIRRQRPLHCERTTCSNKYSILSACWLISFWFLILSDCCFIIVNSKNCNVHCNDYHKKEKQVPIPIFIMAGQSNMMGHGVVSNLEQLINEPNNAHDDDDEYEYDHLWNSTSETFAQRHDVYIDVPGHRPRVGPLSVRYGADISKFGPELEFGWVIGDKLSCSCSHKPIVILKYAQGGKTLAVDFRPPSSGIGSYSNRTVTDNNQYGNLFRELVQYIKKFTAHKGERLANVLYDLPPAEIATRGFQISGLVWFQGWNDFMNGRMADEYENNLSNFIHDIRKELKTPNLPIVIGELGMHGDVELWKHWRRSSEKVRMIQIREAQERVTRNDKRKKTKLIKTSNIVDEIYPSDRNMTKANGFETHNEIQHYFGRTDIILRIGKAFGDAMIDLLQEDDKNNKKNH